jgi:hypothetical protein
MNKGLRVNNVIHCVSITCGRILIVTCEKIVIVDLLLPIRLLTCNFLAFCLTVLYLGLLCIGIELLVVSLI